MDKLICIFIISLICTPVFSQKDSLQSNIISYNEKMIVSLSIEQNNDSFFSQYEEGEEFYNVKFTPVTKRKLYANFTYKLIDVTSGYAFNFINGKSNQKNSKTFNLGFRVYHKQWTQSFTYLNHKGFNITVNDVNVFYPKLESFKIGGKTSYVFNDNFSFRTFFNQSQWQKKSAGSFIPNLSFYYTKLRSKEETDSYNNGIFTITISPSYYYNYVINQKILIGGGIALGGGVNINGKEVDKIIEFSPTFRVAYNSKSFFASIGYSDSSFLFINKYENYSNSLDALKFEIGYRFDPPNRVKKVYDEALNRSIKFKKIFIK